MESSQRSGFDILVPSRMPRSPGVNNDGSGRHSGSQGLRTHIFTSLLKTEPQGLPDPGYYSIPVRWLCPGIKLSFSVYRTTWTGEIVLVCDPGRAYAPSCPESLDNDEPTQVLIRKESRLDLLHYLDRNLGRIVANPLMNHSEKAEFFYYLGYRRLRLAYRIPGKEAITGIRNLVTLMDEEVLGHKKVMKQIMVLVRSNGCKATEHPESVAIHALNVGIISAFLVKEILPSLSRKTLEDASLGYFMHNVGMMRVPREIVDHAGPLSEAEWSLVRKHPEWGLEIVKSVLEPTREMARIVMDHHERPGGNGYPRSLSGTDTHFFVKVCALVDAFDAMVSQRRYKKTLSVAEALKQLKSMVPEAYDPSLFSALVRVLLDNDVF